MTHPIRSAIRAAIAKTPDVVFFAPHNDDETLFGAFSILRYSPLVVVVLRSHKQEASYGPGATAEKRERETERALLELDTTAWEQWAHPDDRPDWDAVEAEMRALDLRVKPSKVFAPAYEEGGHDQHNEVGLIANNVFRGRVVEYLTYVRGSLRSRGDDDHEVRFESDWPAKKLKAMACYRSQIALPQTRPWFLDDTLREWYAPAGFFPPETS